MFLSIDRSQTFQQAEYHPVLLASSTEELVSLNRRLKASHNTEHHALLEWILVGGSVNPKLDGYIKVRSRAARDADDILAGDQ